MNALPGSICAEASQLLVSYLYAYFRGKGTPFLASNNIALSRTLFEALGGFDARFPLAGGEDRDFCARAVQRGHQLVYVEEAIVRHYHALTLRRFARQHANYGRGALFFHQMDVARGGSKGTLEPLRFYRDLIAYPFVAPGIRRRFHLSLLMLLSQGATAGGFLYEKVRRRLADTT